MEKLISVIVPIYKVEKYMDTCIDSIVNQTYKNLEIILVDDGSPDECPKKCDEWAKRDSRIITIHKSNGGLSSARNAGLDIATGNFIAFVDSDDWIKRNMYEDLISLLNENSDVDFAASKVMCYLEISEKYVPFLETKDRFIICNTIKIDKIKYRELTLAYSLESAAWNKLYRKEYINTLRFKCGRLFEDYLFNYYATEKMNSMIYTSNYYYYYRIRPNSITTTFDSRNIIHWEDNFKEIETDIIINHNDNLIKYLRQFQFLYYYDLFKRTGENVYIKKIRNLKIDIVSLPLRQKAKYILLFLFKNKLRVFNQ